MPKVSYTQRTGALEMALSSTFKAWIKSTSVSFTLKKPTLTTNKIDWKTIHFNSSVQRYGIHKVITQGTQQQVRIWKWKQLFYHNGITVNQPGIQDRGTVYAVDT